MATHGWEIVMTSSLNLESHSVGVRILAEACPEHNARMRTQDAPTPIAHAVTLLAEWLGLP